MYAVFIGSIPNSNIKNNNVIKYKLVGVGLVFNSVRALSPE